MTWWQTWWRRVSGWLGGLGRWLAGRWRLGRRPAGPVLRRWPSWGAVAGAVLLCCMSMTPSLLPRTWWLHGAIGGVSAALGYAIGAAIGAAVRFAGLRPGPRTMRVAWIVLGVVSVALFVQLPFVAHRWELQARRLVGLSSKIDTLTWALIPFLVILVFAVVIAVARLIRLGTRKVIGVLDRVVPRPAAYVAGLALVVVVLAGAVQGFLYNGLLRFAERTASLANGATSKGVTQPTSPLLSGSPASAVSWKSLGAKGRDFIGTTPTVAAISAFSGRPATQPIRVYVGLKSASTLAARAQLAVAELDRTGAFDRKVLAVMATTGSGWVDERAAAPLEYMYDGDTAEVGLQYSYLPSWISVLSEDEATKAGKALIQALQAHWASLPAGKRPLLLLFGESLGSNALENAFPGGISQLAAQTDGAVLEGPPSFNPIWRRLTEDRDPGSPAWRPVYRAGATVRFAQTAADLRSPNSPWSAPRIVYLQNASDPIVFWHIDLLGTHPAWLRPPRGPDVSGDLEWLPLVTFWQLLGDVAVGNNVPAGHGHQYGPIAADAWAAVAPPPGWTQADTDRLHALTATIKKPGAP